MNARVWIGLAYIERAWRDGELGYSPNALAAGSRRAKTPKAVECEASQSGGSDSERNAQPSPAQHPKGTHQQ